MKEVGITKLAEIKTVFNSNSDNVYYYELLNRNNSHIINNVELAKPIIRQSNSTIIWKSEFKGELKPFNELSDDSQASVSVILKSFFDAFEQKINSFRSAPASFAKKVIEIPNKDSIFLNLENDHIVITNWGFLEDSPTRKEGVIEKLFDKERNSILVKLVNQKGNPISNIKLRLESKLEREFSLSDSNGFARFGTLMNGERFSIFEDNGFDQNELASFICDERIEYEVVKNQIIDIGLTLKNSNVEVLPNEEITIFSKELGKQTFFTNHLGKVFFSHSVVLDNFKVYDNRGKQIFINEIPDENTHYEIILRDEIKLVEEEVIESANEEEIIEKNNENPKIIRFENYFGKPIKHFKVCFWENIDDLTYYETDENGEILLGTDKRNILNYSFHKFKKRWDSKLDLSLADYHIIKIKPLFPWLWWFLILILSLLVICCFFFNCFCKEINQNASESIVYPETNNSNSIIDNTPLPCDTNIASGGEGVTSNQHYLGERAGKVVINYDMQYVPDKLEVFYENNLVTSTYDIFGNENGFVGESNSAGCCGELIFEYVPETDTHIIIKVSGTNETIWTYIVDCPK